MAYWKVPELSNVSAVGGLSCVEPAGCLLGRRASGKLGVTWNASHAEFSLFSANAERVTLCLFDSPSDRTEAASFDLTRDSEGIWRTHLIGIGPGQLYGYRVAGSNRPQSGRLFNPGNILLDPYARAVGRPTRWRGGAQGVDNPPTSMNGSRGRRFNDVCHAPLGAVIDPQFDWGDDRPPNTPWRDTVIYELHVRGFSKRRPDVAAPLQGTYAGLAAPASVEYLRKLGITAVELLPVQHHVDDSRLERLGLTNYWGYQPLAYFAPEPSYAAATAPQGVVNEFKAMVRTLHRAGIEVILDVVYNHTGEGGSDGPPLSFRGIDNVSYYRLAADRRQYIDNSGCGNSLNTNHPTVLRLVMDSLRYWVEEMHVDGFRFDLAVCLGRTPGGFKRWAPFFMAVSQDPVLRRVKLIAEPWDLGPGGYQLGRFPNGWAEWNSWFRDDVRQFWLGSAASGKMGMRLAGSSDLFEHRGRSPQAGINLVTAHDGFTLADLVSYNEKHNEENGEDGRDGECHNSSWNHGMEGPTDNDSIHVLRSRQQRNLLATLFLSQGVPMLLAGDEFGRTQQGNNNAYCQDNPISWLDWDLDRPRKALYAFAVDLIALRKRFPTLRRTAFFKGTPQPPCVSRDIRWFKPNGDMRQSDWRNHDMRCFGARIAGNEQTPALLMLLNPTTAAESFSLPGAADWELLFDTADDEARGSKHSGSYLISFHSLALFQQAEAHS